MRLGKYDVALHKAPHYMKLLGRRFVRSRETAAAFVVGNQRSGTTMLLSKLNRHFDVDIFHERSEAMKEWRLRPFPEITSILNSSKAKVCVFKPLEDSHRVGEMLRYFQGSRAMFVFRHFADVVNSSMRLGWGRHLRQYIQNINDGVAFEFSGALNITTENTDLVQDLFINDMSEESCIALVWYLRNTIYFDHRLNENPAILLVQYERVTTSPKSEMERILKFLDLAPSRSVLYDVSSESIRKAPPPLVDERVERVCANMYQNLINAAGGQAPVRA